MSFGLNITTYPLTVTRQLQCAKQCLHVYYNQEDALISSHSDEHGRYHIVAIEGTDSLTNWIHNIMIVKRNGVHVGFRKYTTYLKKKYCLRTKLRHLHSPAPIYFTGHSLGACASTLLAYDFANEYNVGTVLFGSPKVGNSTFNASYRGKRIPTRSYRTKYDIVSHLPFTCMGYDNLDRIVLNTSDIPKNDIMLNHSINTYIKELTSLAYPNCDYVL